ncbi:MAG TPA: MBL fold metallo-hydrolase [Anaeromyxobacter sp.]|nr:MBL fold metallo-hydrolase [Anaeromyxobacter sp.]
MTNPVSRRDFLKYSMATGALVASGDGALQAARAEPAKGSPEVDKLTVWTVTDNYYDTNRPDARYAKRYRAGPGRSFHAEHGVSFYVEAVVGGRTNACMFDYGSDPVGVANNLALLGIDVGKVDAFALSHGHWDHYTSAAAILARNKARIAAGTPFYVGEEAFARRYSLRPGASEPTDLGQLRREDIEDAGLKVVEVKAPVQIVPGGQLTGPIERVTPYEKGQPSMQVRRGDKLEQDAFPGEQGLFFHVRGKGLVVISGCAHAGIVNTVRQAMKVAGTTKLLAVMGGCHLINAKPEVIESTVGDLKSMKPECIVPAHCSGFEAILALNREMPNEFVLNTAGTQFTFAA